jgi:hypothetical protein
LLAVCDAIANYPLILGSGCGNCRRDLRSGPLVSPVALAPALAWRNLSFFWRFESRDVDFSKKAQRGRSTFSASGQRKQQDVVTHFQLRTYH